MGAKRIALLGAESTGKTRLSLELAGALREQGLRAVAVPEVLREWCTAAGRAPRPEEQLAIGEEQERRVDAAARDAEVVVADTTALMVAIYGALLFEDHPLHRFAIERQRGYHATLLTGLDLPWVPDGLHRDGEREPVDALVRAELQKAGVPYQVVYGTGVARLHNALGAALNMGIGSGAPRGTAPRRPWVWSCDHCGDAECEHRLFTRLREERR